MEEIDQLQALADLPSGKELPLPVT